MGKAADCGRDRVDCACEALEKVERRLFMFPAYELARSSFALEGVEVTSGGSEVRFGVDDAMEPGSLRGLSTSAAISGCLCLWCGRATSPSVMSPSRRGSVGVVLSVMRSGSHATIVGIVVSTEQWALEGCGAVVMTAGLAAERARREMR